MEAKTEFEDRLLTEAEAAEYLGIAKITLRGQRARGTQPGKLVEIPWIKLGGRCVRYSLADLRAVVAARRVGGAK